MDYLRNDLRIFNSSRAFYEAMTELCSTQWEMLDLCKQILDNGLIFPEERLQLLYDTLDILFNPNNPKFQKPFSVTYFSSHTDHDSADL